MAVEEKLEEFALKKGASALKDGLVKNAVHSKESAAGEEEDPVAGLNADMEAIRKETSAKMNKLAAEASADEKEKMEMMRESMSGRHAPVAGNPQGMWEKAKAAKQKISDVTAKAEEKTSFGSMFNMFAAPFRWIKKVLGIIFRPVVFIAIIAFFIILLAPTKTLLGATLPEVKENVVDGFRNVKLKYEENDLYRMYDSYLNKQANVIQGNYAQGVQENVDKPLGFKFRDVTNSKKEYTEHEDVWITGEILGQSLEENIDDEVLLSCKSKNFDCKVSPESISFSDLKDVSKGFRAEIYDVSKDLTQVDIFAEIPFTTNSYHLVTFVEKEYGIFVERQSEAFLDRFKQEKSISTAGPGQLNIEVKAGFPIKIDMGCSEGEPGCDELLLITVDRSDKSTNQYYKQMDSMTLTLFDGVRLSSCGPIGFDSAGNNVYTAVKKDLDTHIKNLTDPLTISCKINIVNPELIVQPGDVEPKRIDLTASYVYVIKRGQLVKVEASKAAGIATGTFAWPLPSSYKRLTSCFAHRECVVPGPTPGTCSSTLCHPGADVSAPAGTSVYAANGGTVTAIESIDINKKIFVDHGSNIITEYTHVSPVSGLSVGQTVGRGEKIAVVGAKDAYSNAPHLHFGVINNNVDISSLSNDQICFNTKESKPNAIVVKGSRGNYFNSICGYYFSSTEISGVNYAACAGKVGGTCPFIS